MKGRCSSDLTHKHTEGLVQNFEVRECSVQIAWYRSHLGINMVNPLTIRSLGNGHTMYRGAQKHHGCSQWTDLGENTKLLRYSVIQPVTNRDLATHKKGTVLQPSSAFTQTVEIPIKSFGRLLFERQSTSINLQGWRFNLSVSPVRMSKCLGASHSTLIALDCWVSVQRRRHHHCECLCE